MGKDRANEIIPQNMKTGNIKKAIWPNKKTKLDR
jgi:hypothetical protein